MNDKTAKTMLSESFRRQLLMDGQYGALLFIATQSDSLTPSEIKDNLRLPPSATPAQCAAARCEYTKRRIQADFYDGLVEMHTASGMRSDRAALEARFRLPVFTLSATDFQKLSGLRPLDGESLWGDVEGTEVPALRRFVYEAAVRRRKATIQKQVDAMMQFIAGMEGFLGDDGTADSGKRDAARKAFEAAAGPLRAALDGVKQRFSQALVDMVKQAVGPQLRSGAEEASKECCATAVGWRAGSAAKGPGMHWATYKATCRRGGEFRRNFNEARLF